MAMPFIYVEPEVKPDEPHNVKFKPRSPEIDRGEIKYLRERSKCIICGATEETEICNRTFES